MPATLPQDVLELVFNYVETYDVLESDADGTSWFEAVRLNFYRLCLVSRDFCHVGRQLIESLRANQRYLGKLVMDLSQVIEGYDVLQQAETTPGPTSFQFRGFSKAFSWQLAIFATCTNCQRISAGYGTEPELKKLLRIVLSSLPDLRHIELVSRESYAIATPDTLRSLQGLAQLASIEIEGIGQKQRLAKEESQLRLNVSDLSLTAFDAPLSSFFAFLPDDGSRLTKMCLWFSIASEADLVELVTHTPNLVHLYICSTALHPGNSTIWRYGHMLKRLRVLLKQPPKIRRLSVFRSVWIRDDDASDIFPTDDLIEIFPTFQHLELAHLGTIPLQKSEAMKPLIQVFKKMGADLTFDWAAEMAATLPQDVLDIIFGFLEAKANTRAIPQHLDVWLDIGTKRTDARRHWLRLCLVCRSFLHAARRFLYKKPFAAANRRPASLFHLAEMLRANHRYLGKLVVDLTGAAERYELLEEMEGSLGPVSFQFRGFTKAFSWIVTLFSTCTNCRFASAAFSSQVELRKVLRTMAASLPDLQRLELRGFGFVADNNLLSPSFLTILTIFKDLSELHLVGIPHGQHSTSHTVPQLPLQPKKLVMSVAAQFYGTDAEHSKVPLEVFGALPNLLHLELRSFAAFSTDRLRLLAATSPQLKYLSGVTSLWISDCRFAVSFDGHKVAEVFKHFKQLESAHIGYLPRTSADVVEPIQCVFDEPGAQLVYDRAPSYFLLV
ncbi:hypothetical protein JCM10296v2_005262 [Rhodotorula toruloides]